MVPYAGSVLIVPNPPAYVVTGEATVPIVGKTVPTLLTVGSVVPYVVTGGRVAP